MNFLEIFPFCLRSTHIGETCDYICISVAAAVVAGAVVVWEKLSFAYSVSLLVLSLSV